MSNKKISRGQRNNNPGNIRKSKDKWQGLAAHQPDNEFFTFKDPTYGIRAMARIIIKYQDDYNCHTITDIINRWAPPNGDRNGSAPGGEYTQNTKGYINAVAKAAGVHPTQHIDVHHFDTLFPIMKAMMKHEMGYEPPYSDAQITKGLVLAGVEPEKPKSLVKDKKVVASGAVGGLTLVSAASEHIEAVSPAFSLMETLAMYAPYVLTAIVICVIGYIIYDIYQDRKRGL